jgi:hypothetical protein
VIQKEGAIINLTGERGLLDDIGPAAVDFLSLLPSSPRRQPVRWNGTLERLNEAFLVPTQVPGSAYWPSLHHAFARKPKQRHTPTPSTTATSTHVILNHGVTACAPQCAGELRVQGWKPVSRCWVQCDRVHVRGHAPAQHIVPVGQVGSCWLPWG